MATRSEAAPAPAPSPARLHDVDALRGFALLGILMVNIGYFASGYTFHGTADPAFRSTADEAVRSAVTLLFTMKFYVLFSFLFGYSLTLQTAVSERAGAAPAPRHLRRSAGLLVLGLLHAVLLFQGDILATYAVLGLVLYAFRHVRTRTALVAAAVLVGWVVLIFSLLALAAPVGVDEKAALEAGRATTEALAGGPASIIAEHLENLPAMAVALLFQQAPTALAMFFVGLAAGRLGVLAEPARHAVLLRRVQWIGLAVGGTGAMAYAVLDGSRPFAAIAIASVTAPLLSAAYATTLLRVFRRGAGQRVRGALAPAGRMALTNYLSQSLVCVLLFTGAGAGLVGSVPPAGVLGIAAALFAVQLLWSRWWLGRHRYGPVEYALRAFSYASLPGRGTPAASRRG